MGARFKMYDDRQFCNGHRTVTIGMPVGYLVSGCYSVEKNLQTIIEGRANVGQNFSPVLLPMNLTQMRKSTDWLMSLSMHWNIKMWDRRTSLVSAV